MYKDGSKIRGGRGYRQKRYLKQMILERDNYICQLCGRTKDEVGQLDVDHIIPWHIGHDSSPSNLRVLCHSCNLKGRRYTLPEGRMRSLPFEEWETYLRRELADSALA